MRPHDSIRHADVIAVWGSRLASTERERHAAGECACYRWYRRVNRGADCKLSGIPTHADEDELNLVYRPESGKVGEGGGPALVNLHIDARLGRAVLCMHGSRVPQRRKRGGGTTAFPCVDQDESLTRSTRPTIGAGMII